MDGEKVIQLVLSAQERSKKAAEEVEVVCKKYNVAMVVTEMRENGQTTQIGVQWVPVELAQQKRVIQIAH